MSIPAAKAPKPLSPRNSMEASEPLSKEQLEKLLNLHDQDTNQPLSVVLNNFDLLPIFLINKNGCSSEDPRDLKKHEQVEVHMDGADIKIHRIPTKISRIDRHSKLEVEVYALPGPKERTVMEAIKYLAHNGYSEYTKRDGPVVSFRLSQLRTLLENVFNVSYNYLQLREAVNILIQTHFTIESLGIQYKSSLLQSVNDTKDDTTYIVMLHPLHRLQLERGKVRISELQVITRYGNDFAGALWRMLILRYNWSAGVKDIEDRHTQAFQFHANAFLKSQGYDVELTDDRRNGYRNIRRAMALFKKNGDIADYKESAIKEHHADKVPDIHFEVWGTDRFSQETFRINGINKKVNHQMSLL